jgi:protein-S-isoprenylcysteine O-methyltransferase Ste14
MNGRRRFDVPVALATGALCHAAFLAGVGWMAFSLATGLQSGIGRLPAPWSAIANAALALQFPLLHSWLLTRRGRRALSSLLRGDRGSTLAPTLYATCASLQVLAVFALWTPSGVVWWEPRGGGGAVAWVAFAASWSFLIRALHDGHLGLQTGAIGWLALLRGRRPDFGSMPAGGLFGRCRQPIYLGFLLVLCTAPTRTPDQLLLALVWAPYCLLGPLLKEQRFLAIFGAEFVRYRQRVPYFVPRLRRRSNEPS